MNYLQSELPWIFLMIAIVGDFVVPYLLALFYPGYSHKKQVMSVLGNPQSPVSRIYNSWLIVLGVLFCLSSVKVYFEYQKVSNFYSGTVLIIMIIFGIGAGVLAGLFSVDEKKNLESTASKIHGIGAGIGFILLVFIPLIIGLLSFYENKIAFGILSILMFFISILFFTLFIMSEREKYKDSVIGLSGLWQRLLLGSMYFPLFLIASSNVFSS